MCPHAPCLTPCWTRCCIQAVTVVQTCGLQCALIIGHTEATALTFKGRTWEPLTKVSLSSNLARDSVAASSQDPVRSLDNNEEFRVVLHVPALGDHLSVNAAAAVAAVCACMSRECFNDENNATPGKMLQLATSVLMKLERGKWLRDWTPSCGRMCVHHVNEHLLILDDTYNANPASMMSALKTLQSTVINGAGHNVKRLAVLGPMHDLGPHQAIHHQNVVASALLLPDVDVLLWGGEWGVSSSASAESGMEKDSRKSFMHIPGPQKQNLFDAVINWAHTGGSDLQLAIVLLKGSRAAKMEEVLSYVQAHPF